SASHSAPVSPTDKCKYPYRDHVQCNSLSSQLRRRLETHTRFTDMNDSQP
ncbi:hypothetical protein BV20DRAFT_949899, partial [Pilatotrama ljubarskyi]